MPGRGSPLDWRAKVELFEEIRREYEFGVGTIAGVSGKVKVHRRMVREAIASALPKARKKTERPHSKLQAAIPFVDQILQGDRQAPRKQRHTPHRICRSTWRHCVQHFWWGISAERVITQLFSPSWRY